MRQEEPAKGLLTAFKGERQTVIRLGAAVDEFMATPKTACLYHLPHRTYVLIIASNAEFVNFFLLVERMAAFGGRFGEGLLVFSLLFVRIFGILPHKGIRRCRGLPPECQDGKTGVRWTSGYFPGKRYAKNKGEYTMKRKIDPFDYAGTILHAVRQGVLLTTQAEGRTNTMTISWGTLGIEWGKPLFTVFVRESRVTRELLEKHPEFTVNMPRGDGDKAILPFCGTQSGREVDKIKELSLSLEAPEVVCVPAIRELPLTLECRLAYKQAQDPLAIAAQDRCRFYPSDVDGSFPGANRDYHTAYYGEIVAAYILE